MLTIDEIKDISFRRGRGYKGEDVDAFIDDVIVTFEQIKKEKSDLVRKMDILATRVEQYRADEETVRNALLSSQRVADTSIKEANAKAAQIVADAETKAQKMLLEANTVTAMQKDIYLKLKNDAANLRKELEEMYNKHLKSITDLPTDAAVLKAKMDLDKKYPTEEIADEADTVEEAQEKATVEMPVIEDVEQISEPEYTDDTFSKYENLKFGENYDVEAE